jgi:hypothetical protein
LQVHRQLLRCRLLKQWNVNALTALTVRTVRLGREAPQGKLGRKGQRVPKALPDLKELTV